MEQNPGQESNAPGGEYKGYTPQQPNTAYSPDEMPQSTYPHDGAGQSQEQYGAYGSQQSYEQQQYGSQQQSQYQQQQQYQPPFGQFGAGDASYNQRTSMGIKARTAGILCYVFGWIGGIVFLLLERENQYVRFNAMQSILLFGILGIAQYVFSRIPFFGPIAGALGIVTFVCWIFMLIKASSGRYYKLPIIGDYAEKFANQFRV